MPLNQNLYDALKVAVRAGLQAGGLPGREVKIINDGLSLSGHYTTDAIKLRKQLKVDNLGEQYRVCCPFCGDTRYRLHVSHRWNVYDVNSDSYNRHLIRCFNEECQGKVPGFHIKFADMLKPYVRKANNKEVVLATGYEPPPRRIEPPGPLVRIDQLDAEHHVCRFLRQRRHDPQLLGTNFGLSYCTSSRLKFAENRLIFPVHLDGMLKGWQARYIDKDAGGDVKRLYRCSDCNHSWRELSESSTPKLFSLYKESKHPKVCPNCASIGAIDPVPKYYTCPGMSKTRCMLNYDTARKWPFGIIVEGPMDVLRIGTPDGPDRAGPAVCIFGHVMSPQQKDLAKAAWSNGGLIVILDPDAIKDQNHLLGSLSGHYRYVLAVNLPDGRDPDECEHGLIWELILATAKAKGVTL